MTHQLSSHRRGFVTFIAMTMLVVVVAAMLVIGQTFTLDARRTLARQLDAQLDQMLLAGTVDASAKLAASPAVPVDTWKVALPDSISGSSSLEIMPAQGNTAEDARMTIHAIYADRKASQHIRFQKINGVWKLTAAELSDRAAVAVKR